MNEIAQQVTVVATAIVGVAIIAVILSRNSNTSNVISAAGSGFSHSLAAALSPITSSGAYTGSF